MTQRRWRVILTDSESLTGVAPVCPHVETNHLIEDNDGAPLPDADALGVYDCCPGPHLECWTPAAALRIRAALNTAEVEVCQ